MRKAKNRKPSIASKTTYLSRKYLRTIWVPIGIGVIAVFVAIYWYAIAILPPVDLPSQDVSEKATKDHSAQKESSKRTRSMKTTANDLDDEKRDAELDELLKQKTITSLEEGWVSIKTEPFPTLKLSSDFKDRQAQYLDMITNHTPTFLVDDQLLDKWPIFRWDLYSKAKEKNISLENCRYQWISPVFVLGQEREKGGMLGSAHDLPLVYINVTLLQFLQSTFQEKTWLYWTEELETFEQLYGQMGTLDHHFSASTKDQQAKKKRKTKKKSTGWEYFIIQEEDLQITNNEDAQERNNKISSKNKTNITTSETNLTKEETKNRGKEEEEDDDKDNEDESYDLDFWRPMLWLSHPGVIAQAHYDTQHNIFIQLQGLKRFYLFPPSLDLSPFPNIHYSYRQSQIPFHLSRSLNLTAAKDYTFPQLHPSNASVYEILLKPGDILYIPPYWSHLVESLSFSMSLSILSPSTIEAALAEIYWQKVPFGEFRASRFLRMKIIQQFFELFFIKKNSSKKFLEEFATELFQSRYAPMEEGLFATLKHLRPESFCYDLPSPSSSNDLTLLELREQLQEPYQQFQDLFANHSEVIVFAVSRLQEMFMNFTTRATSKLDEEEYYQAIKKLFLQDYLEQLIRWAVGPSFTPFYLKHCFTRLKQLDDLMKKE